MQKNKGQSLKGQSVQKTANKLMHRQMKEKDAADCITCPANPVGKNLV